MDVKFSFEDAGDGPFGHIYRPIAKVIFISPKNNKTIAVWMVVDTGADYTILPRYLSEKLNISLEHDCIKNTTFGIGGEQVVYFYKKRINVQIGNIKRKIPMAFLNNNDVPALLGRLGFSETFDTEFSKKHIVIFKE